MELTNKQIEGLNIAIQRFRDNEPYTVISGYAGSGKSTLIKFIIDALELEDNQVAYVAYTGKAATVLRRKGCPNAMTAHKLLYRSMPMPNGTFRFLPKTSLDERYQVIVVDEVSMLPASMWNLLLSHHIYVLATGDPGQLPPVNKDDDNKVLAHPHVFLDQIMRQAQESEIIRLSMFIREGNPLDDFDCCNEQVKIVNKNEVVTGMYEWADQILCATNRTRNQINKEVRELKGYPADTPTQFDKVISLRNHWDMVSPTTGNALTNGTIGYLTNFSSYQNIYVPKYIYQGAIPILVSNLITDEDDQYTGLVLDYNSLVKGEKTLTPRQEFQMAKNKMCMDPPLEFVYGYAITCHKSQGSEWNKILAFEERFPFDKEEHRRWLYTACTRASDKLVIVKEN